MMKLLTSLFVGLTLMSAPVYAQNGPLRLELDEGIIEPLPFAVPNFVPDGPAAAQFAQAVKSLKASVLSLRDGNGYRHEYRDHTPAPAR